jgi:hypothetical protein
MNYVTLEDIEKYVPIYVCLYGEVTSKESLIHMVNWFIDTKLEVDDRNWNKE